MDGVDERMRSVFRRLIENKERWPLFLFGSPGRGKTCAALALLDYVPWNIRCEESRDGIPPLVHYEAGGRYWTAEQLVGFLFGNDWPDDIRKCRLAVLDELGERSKNTDVNYTTVKRFADERDRKPTIYISNLSPNDIASAYDDRIASRVLCGTCFDLTGPDRRMSE